MARRLARPGRLWPLLLLMAGLLTACQPGRPPAPTAAERQAALTAEGQRRELERCNRDRDELRRQLEALRFTQRQLARVRSENYVPSARPQPLDPELEARFSLADQELDSLRHEQALERWRAEERQRSRAWRERHGSLLQGLEQRQREQLQELRALNSSLFEPDQPQRLRPAAVARYSSCDPKLF